MTAQTHDELGMTLLRLSGDPSQVVTPMGYSSAQIQPVILGHFSTRVPMDPARGANSGFPPRVRKNES